MPIIDSCPPGISPTDISQFIRLDQCERYLHLRLKMRREGSDFLYDNGTSPHRIPPLLTRAGSAFESDVEKSLRQNGWRVANCAQRRELSVFKAANATPSPSAPQKAPRNICCYPGSFCSIRAPSPSPFRAPAKRSSSSHPNRSSTSSAPTKKPSATRSSGKACVAAPAPRRCGTAKKTALP
jgi:hypothetical protein